MKSNTYRFAEKELSILSKSAIDPENRPIIEPFKEEILALCEKFAHSGQSGGSAPMTATVLAQAIKKLLLQEPICPIMNLPEEWVDVTEYNDGNAWFHNARCSGLFKDGIDGRPYYLDAVVWVDDKAHQFTGSAWMGAVMLYSRQYVKSFPFTPKRFYIDVVDREVGKDNWEHFVKTPAQLRSVFKYYDRYPDK